MWNKKEGNKMIHNFENKETDNLREKATNSLPKFHKSWTKHF